MISIPSTLQCHDHVIISRQFQLLDMPLFSVGWIKVGCLISQLQCENKSIEQINTRRSRNVDLMWGGKRVNGTFKH